MISCIDKKKPYPGLRPFRSDEADLFFGREEQVDSLLDKLQNSRFVAVIGPSGCGKSSLVRAGLIPALRTGFLAGAGARWRIIQMRPGHQPYYNLARSVLHTFKGETPLELIKAELKRSQKGLVEVIKGEDLRPKENVLLIVDQFEELFRFRQNKNIDEVTAFINLLINCAHQCEVPVYVVITMRSDYLGECSLFHGLSEILNDNQFLTPRLTREQSKKAIVGPVLVMEGKIEPTLVNTLLNDLWVDHDQLPLLQHALMRMWALVNADKKEEETEMELLDSTPNGVTAGNVLTTGHYIKVGKLSRALSLHANDVYGKLDSEQQRIASIMFKRLTDRTPEQKDVRRPTTIKEIAKVAKTSVEQVVEVSKKFRAPDNNFLMPEEDVEVSEGSYLDLSHESIMRQWDTLKKWMDEEQQSAKMFRWLSDTVKFNSGYLRSSDLKAALKWEAQQPNNAWAARYADNFDKVIAFIRKSRVKSRNNRFKAYGVIALFVVAMSGLAFMQVKNSRMQVKNLKITEALLEKRNKELLLDEKVYKLNLQTEFFKRERQLKEVQETEMKERMNELIIERNKANIERNKADIERNTANTVLSFRNSAFDNCTNIDQRTKIEGLNMMLSYVGNNNLKEYRSKMQSLNEMATAMNSIETMPNEALCTIKKILKSNKEPVFKTMALEALNKNLFYVQKFSPKYTNLHTTSLSVNRNKREFVYNIESEVVHGIINDKDSLVVDVPNNLNIAPHITSLAVTNNSEIIGRVKSKLLYWKKGIKTNISFPVDTESYVKVSPDGKLLFTLSDKLQLWKIDDLKRFKDSPVELKGSVGVNTVAFSADSKLIALGYDNHCVLWSTTGYVIDSLSSGELNKRDTSKNHTDEEKELDNNDPITGLSISEDGKIIIIGTYAGKIKIWRRHNAIRPIEIIDLEDPISDITRISLSPDSKKALIGSPRHPYSLYIDLDTWQSKKIADRDTLFVYCDFLNDSTIISADYLGGLYLWKVYPQFLDVDKAFSVIKASTVGNAKYFEVEEEIEKGTIAYQDLLRSKDADSLAFAVVYFYRKGTEDKDKGLLAISGQLCLQLIDILDEKFSAKYIDYLLKINTELNDLEPLDYSGQIDRLKENIRLREKLLKMEGADSSTLKYQLSVDYGNLSWAQLFVRDFQNVIKSAQKGLDIHPANDWIYTNLALGYLLTKQFDKSENIYVELKYKVYSNGKKSFKTAFLEDFETLEKAGIISPRDLSVYIKVAEIKVLLR